METYLWTWSGHDFGHRDGDELWTYDGRHVGHFYGTEVYARDGRNLGELQRDDHLITRIVKRPRRPFRVFDKIQTVTPGAIVENKRLGVPFLAPRGRGTPTLRRSGSASMVAHRGFRVISSTR